MLTPQTAEKIGRIAQAYPFRSSALIPALELVQRENRNSLSDVDIQDIAALLQMPVGEVHGVASFYSLVNINKRLGTYHIQIDTSIPATLLGVDTLLAHLEHKLGITCGQTTPDGMFTLATVDDLASGGTCPVIRVNTVYYENMTIAKVDQLVEALRSGRMPDNVARYNYESTCNVLLKNRGTPGASALAVYKKGGGYSALAKARQMQPEAIIKAVMDSGLRGRGGAGYPTGAKWSAIPRDGKKPVYLICNADEGEPGTFKDRLIMEYDPHLLLEGILIAAHAIGAKQAFICIRGEFDWIADILEKAKAEARAEGLMDGCEITIHRGAGSYVSGEETALIESLEGKRGQPRVKPPFPSEYGLFGNPTIVNNVETISAVPFITEHGAQEFKQWGFADNYGFKLYAISGHVNKPGVYEYPMGTPFMDLLAAAGGVTGRLKAAIVGGLSAPILTADELQDLCLDYTSCKDHGTMLGSRGIMIMNQEVAIPAVALRSAEFYARESCGKCTPCREGSYIVSVILKKIKEGYGERRDINRILELTGSVQDAALCPVGGAFAGAVRTMVEKFRPEFEALVK